MKTSEPINDVQLSERLGRSSGRSSRNRVANTRVTESELQEVEEAAKLSGKALSEWSREVLLNAARNRSGDPLFTEIVGLRMLFAHLIQPLLAGAGLPPETLNKAMKEVREQKYKIALEVMQQYQNRSLTEQ
jgi:hypothetical protein